MLTRLKVSGFKNLIDVDVYFGPFTCIAGANGTGKSNLFDAIVFLSSLADRSLTDAALSVRDEGGRMSDLRGIFHQSGNDYDRQMSFEAEMIVPPEAQDDLGQKAKASITFLRYTLSLVYHGDDGTHSPLEITKEELTHITQGQAREQLPFPHSPEWRRSAILGRRTSPFISTAGEGSDRVIRLHQEGVQGRTRQFAAANLPRTILSSTNATESPTALVARQEMRSWRLLQLEPSALRRPDEFTAPARMGADGSHVAATLYHLARQNGHQYPSYLTDQDHAEQIYAQVANRLAELIDDVGSVSIDRDERRELLTLMVSDHSGTPYPARALSDGTLRFLALAVLYLDPASQRVLCLEEPENGIHPARIRSMLDLLQDIATDAKRPIAEDNPLRQVIINTHSPSVVSQVPDDSLIVAQIKECIVGKRRFNAARFSSLANTWRTGKGENEDSVARGTLAAYLNPAATVLEQPEHDNEVSGRQRPRRVKDRPDMQLLLPGITASA